MDYRKIDEIKEKMAFMKEMSEMDDEDKEQAFKMFMYEKGKKLQLTVSIEDPELANVILSSAFSRECLMPGMDIEDVRFGDLERKDLIVDYLEEKLHELRQKL